MGYAEEQIKELKRRNKKIDENPNGLKVKPKSNAHKVELYSLIKIQDGKRTRVGFGLTEEEAMVLANSLSRKMRKLPDFDAAGGPLFEITLAEIRKEVQ